jgi:septal ring factor EnvC (AmiA/AmiB activator)
MAHSNTRCRNKRTRLHAEPEQVVPAIVEQVVPSIVGSMVSLNAPVSLGLVTFIGAAYAVFVRIPLEGQIKEGDLKIEAKLSSLEAKSSTIEGQVENKTLKLELQVGQVQTKVDKVQAKVDKVQSKVDEMSKSMERLSGDIRYLTNLTYACLLAVGGAAIILFVK